MGQYKVIQDIEAEDKLVGPLSLRQFIYAVITIVLLFISYRLALANPLLALPLLLPAALFGLLAAPFVHDQSSEIWLLAKITFFLKPRKRIWDQSGVKDLVTVTAPKKIERQLTDNLTQDEVRSHLKALSETIDTRGWAVKNVNVNLSAQPNYGSQLIAKETDRLVAADQALARTTSGIQALGNEVQASDDILDAQNNQSAQLLDKMMDEATKARHEELVKGVQDGSISRATAGRNDKPDYWFLRGGDNSQVKPQVVAPGSHSAIADQPVSADEQQLASTLTDTVHRKSEARKAAFGRLKTLRPVGEQTPAAPATQAQANPAIIQRLADDNNLFVDTVAREANKINQEEDDEGEVVVSLH